MFGLSLGVSRIGSTLPKPVYALLSGLNAATVGIIALAAVQLSQKAITDKVTRAIVFLGGVTGILYTALWFFPVLMISAGTVTMIRWPHRILLPVWRRIQTFSGRNEETSERRRSHSIKMSADLGGTSAGNNGNREGSIHRRVTAIDERDVGLESHTAVTASPDAEVESSDRIIPSGIQLNLISWKTGIYIIAGFLATFVTIMAIRAVLKAPPRGVGLFANLYLAGTIIFGGGPVVIPLLREYIVAEGWVSSRDFLLGLALIQSFPGPNFNFAVYRDWALSLGSWGFSPLALLSW
jgi:chromate transport protein ChrA